MNKLLRGVKTRFSRPYAYLGAANLVCAVAITDIANFGYAVVLGIVGAALVVLEPQHG